LLQAGNLLPLCLLFLYSGWTLFHRIRDGSVGKWADLAFVDPLEESYHDSATSRSFIPKR
jgi:hypothetical protein